MTENEKIILTLLNKSGRMTKPEICKMGHMGWATAVKLINRLLESGIIEQAGIIKRESGQGKSPEVYRFSGNIPTAIGVDVEYKQTRIILTNLEGTIIAASVYDTPENPDITELKKFLSKNLKKFVSRYVKNKSTLAGVGIGLPGIGKESWVKHKQNYSTDLSLYLEKYLETRVLVDINVRVYTVYEKWENRTFSLDDFMFITIRSGIGSGIFLNGSLYYGHQEHAGEIGHMTVKKNGTPCVCGRIGCLQTEVNQNRLYKDYLNEVLKQKVFSEQEPNQDDLKANLPDLFSRAKNGEKPALKIINQAAKFLADGIANTIMILNIPHILISGHFGEDGDILIDSLDSEIRKRILSQMDFTLSYMPLEARGFTLGATLLILGDYFTDLPVQTVSS